MIGLVVVSHSRELAAAVVRTGEQLVPGEQHPRIAVAAGDVDGGLGTDAGAIAAAIDEVDGPDGVLVVVDLGSAVLSAELALELVDPDVARRTKVSACPLVEGFFAALVAASSGAPLPEVDAQACAALAAKQLHLGLPDDDDVDVPEREDLVGPVVLRAIPNPETSNRDLQTRLAIAHAIAAEALGDDAVGSRGSAETSLSASDLADLPATARLSLAAPPVETAAGDESSDDIHLILVVPNLHGLHARPAAALARIVAAHDASLRVVNLSRDGSPMNGASLAALTRLDARRGDRLELTASGPAAGDLITAVLAFAANNFGDDPSPGDELDSDLAIATLPAARRLSLPADSGIDPAAGEPAFSGPLRRLMLDPDPAGSGLESCRQEADARAGHRGAAVRDELGLFDTAVKLAGRQLESIASTAADRIGTNAAAMVSLQAQLLTDSAVVSPVRASIEAGQIALEAWTDHLAMVRNSLEELDNPYLRARGQDIGSLERRVRACMLGRGVPDAAAAAGVVLVDELDAPTAATLRPEQVVAVLTRHGGDQGHGVMVARQRGITVVVDVGDVFDDTPEGTEVSWPPE